MRSKLLYISILIFAMLIPDYSKAHGIKPAIVEYRITKETIEVNLFINAEVFLSGIDASRFTNTANAPESQLYDELRKLPAAKLRSKLEDSINKLKKSVLRELF